jgi:hypothetical protein
MTSRVGAADGDPAVCTRFDGRRRHQYPVAGADSARPTIPILLDVDTIIALASAVTSESSHRIRATGTPSDAAASSPNRKVSIVPAHARTPRVCSASAE